MYTSITNTRSIGLLRLLLAACVLAALTMSPVFADETLLIGTGNQNNGTAKAEEPVEGFIPDQIVVRLAPSSALFDSLTYGLGWDVTASLAHAPVFLINVAQDKAPLEACWDLEARAGVEYAHPNYLLNWLHAVQGSYPFSDLNQTGSLENQPATGTLDLSSCHTLATGTGITVGIIDAGIDIAHSALEGAAAYGYDFVDGDGVAHDEAGGLSSGHGTFVAGVVHLMAPDADIRAYRVIDPDGMGDGFTLARAIEMAVDDGCDVINISLALLYRHLAVRDAIDYAASQGVTVIAAAGNERRSEAAYPAAESNAIAVMAIDKDSFITDFSNFGSTVDVCAPGLDIYSTYMEDGYAWWSGTSFATPFVTGEAALLYEMKPDPGCQLVREAIRTTASDLDALNPEYAGLLGEGLVRPVSALHKIDSLDVAWVDPDTLYFTVDSGAQYLTPPFQYALLGSSNAPADYSFDVLRGGYPRFTYLTYSQGYTNDSVQVSIVFDELGPGIYWNTVVFYVDGVPQTTELIVQLQVDSVGVPPATAELIPDELHFTAQFGTEILLYGVSTLISSNSPAEFTGQVLPGGSGVTTLLIPGGYTDDSVSVTVDPGLAPAIGMYHDTVEFTVEGVPDPVQLMIFLEITDTVGGDNAWTVPETNEHYIAQGSGDTVIGAFDVYSTNAPATYIAAVTSPWQFVELHDSIGVTKPPYGGGAMANLYYTVHPGDLPVGFYIDTIRIWVEDLESEPVDAYVRLEITSGGGHTATIWPDLIDRHVTDGSDTTFTEVIFISSTNAPANYAAGYGDTPDVTTILDTGGMTNDSVLIQIVCEPWMSGLYVDTLLFTVEGVVNNPLIAVVQLHVDSFHVGEDSAWVYPNIMSFYAIEGDTDNVQLGGTDLYSVYGPTQYHAEVTGWGFVELWDSVGYTKPPYSLDTLPNVPFYVNTSGYEVGIYCDTLTFWVDGAVNSPVHAYVRLVVQEAGPPVAIVAPSVLSYEVWEGTDTVINDIIFVSSTNAPAWYLVAYEDNPDITTVLDTAGYTNDTVRIQVRCTPTTPPGPYFDTLRFDVDGVANSPLFVLVRMYVDSVPTGGDTAWAVPDTITYTWTLGDTLPLPPGGFDVYSTNAPANFTASVTGGLMSVILDDSLGTTKPAYSGGPEPSISYTVHKGWQGVGMWVDTIQVWVDGVENNPVEYYVRIIVEDQAAATCNVWPAFWEHHVTEGTEITFNDFFILTSTNAPAAYTVEHLSEQSVTNIVDTVGFTNDSVFVEVCCWSTLPAGFYADTLSFSVEGASNSPQTAVLHLYVDSAVVPEDSAWVDPYELQFNAPFGSTDSLIGGAYVGSSNAPALWFAYVLSGDTSFAGLIDSVGYTDDSIYVIVDPTGLMSGLHHDTVLIEVSGVSNPVPLMVSLVIGADSTQSAPIQSAEVRNFPNPFNPEATIEYSLPVTSHVTVTVYNVIGQQIRTLVDRSQSAGTHQVIWDGTDRNGRQSPTGVYFYRFKAGDYTETRKMVLIK